MNFLWLELTNRCNLECTHCYAGSSPTAVDAAPLSLSEYQDIIRSAAQHGCSAVQFIGGEPTLNKMLPELIEFSSRTGFTFIEVFSNLVSMTDAQIADYQRHGIHLATSIYGASSEVHDAVTTRPGSFERTTRNMSRALDAGIPFRVSVIRMETNLDEIDEAVQWLKQLGIDNVGIDDARAFGRAREEKPCDMGELCGECAGGTLCVDPNGKVSPCIMSRAWGVGDVREDGFSTLLTSQRLKDVRSQIAERVAERMGGCNPSNPNPCAPDQGGPCIPCNPNGNCGPNKCQPHP
ncbi:radical SAM protein [Ruegeria sediminis]|uniref:radical SAM protein n=1 Tax=Ruegeria sediminis TaxID=2583820 RepID=UPI001C5588C3|nr:radical SAM protein [Ruegeria sediminis]